MRILVEVLGEVDPEDLWPYRARFTPTATGGLIVVSLHDSQEVVGFLLRLSPLAGILRVEPLGKRPGRERPPTSPRKNDADDGQPGQRGG